MATPSIKLDYTVSARDKTGYGVDNHKILPYLKTHFSPYLNDITSVFGFLEYCPLYGGRQWIQPQITEDDVSVLYNMNIGIRIPLTNLYVTRELYEQSKEFLAKYHRKGNSVIVVVDQLAKWIKEDFPLYEIENSIIRPNIIETIEDLDDALKIYDVVVLHGKNYTNMEFMNSIKDKSRVRLFHIMGCGYNCPARICYVGYSRINLKPDKKIAKWCSIRDIPRPNLGTIRFDTNKLIEMGFHKWKIIIKH